MENHVKAAGPLAEIIKKFHIVFYRIFSSF